MALVAFGHSRRQDGPKQSITTLEVTSYERQGVACSSFAVLSALPSITEMPATNQNVNAICSDMQKEADTEKKEKEEDF